MGCLHPYAPGFVCTRTRTLRPDSEAPEQPVEWPQRPQSLHVGLARRCLADLSERHSQQREHRRRPRHSAVICVPVDARHDALRQPARNADLLLRHGCTAVRQSNTHLPAVLHGAVFISAYTRLRLLTPGRRTSRRPSDDGELSSPARDASV